MPCYAGVVSYKVGNEDQHTLCFLLLHSPHEVVVLSTRDGRDIGMCMSSDIQPQDLASTAHTETQHRHTAFLRRNVHRLGWALFPASGVPYMGAGRSG
jgi:hypothetical protein